MKLGIMQPYLFPYIGYFQNIAATDRYVLYDDVSFIRQGWIHRNRILLNGKDFLFTVPLEDASSFKLINETLIKQSMYYQWKTKFCKTLELAYSKAPQFEKVYALVQEVLDSGESTIARLSTKSIVRIAEYLQITTTIIESSVKYGNDHLHGEERVIDICEQEKADQYLNAIGGLNLYSKENFRKKGIELSFVKSATIQYRQLHDEFVPNLSVIDVLMFNDISQVQSMLKSYELI